VTRDFDFLIGEQARNNKELLRTFYEHGFELVTKLDKYGNVLRTLDNQTLAATRLRVDQPQSVYFYNHSLGLRVDLLFDFPLLAKDVRKRSTSKKIRSHAFHIAHKRDLIKMKEIAWKDRQLSTDLQDLDFLRKL